MFTPLLLLLVLVCAAGREQQELRTAGALRGNVRSKLAGTHAEDAHAEADALRTHADPELQRELLGSFLESLPDSCKEEDGDPVRCLVGVGKVAVDAASEIMSNSTKFNEALVGAFEKFKQSLAGAVEAGADQGEVTIKPASLTSLKGAEDLLKPVVDAGKEVLEALRRIPELLTGPLKDAIAALKKLAR